jgi:hypothetical protein
MVSPKPASIAILAQYRQPGNTSLTKLHFTAASLPLPLEGNLLMIGWTEKEVGDEFVLFNRQRKIVELLPIFVSKKT